MGLTLGGRTTTHPACYHEPMVNQTYANCVHHYRTTIVPTRAHRPRKAEVDGGVE